MGFRGEVTSDEGIRGRIAADNRYVESWSFRTDLRLIVQTVPLLFGDANAF
jgi:lipopolysaccharide/colanic/teichoic acid biosynthesis glycosyltransferase